MTELAKKIEDTNFTARPRLELVDEEYLKRQETVDKIVQDYREIYADMLDDEKVGFINTQKENLSDENEIVAKVAQIILNELGEN